MCWSRLGIGHVPVRVSVWKRSAIAGSVRVRAVWAFPAAPIQMDPLMATIVSASASQVASIPVFLGFRTQCQLGRARCRPR
eukprot:11181728-Lingulodinium_polyedra.AAC.1